MPLPLIPLAASGAGTEAIATIIEKNILRKRGLNYKAYHVWGFFAISFIMLAVLAFFSNTFNLWKVLPEALQLKNILLLSFIILISILANLLTFYAMKRENITEMEPLRLFQPLFVIILAFIFYSSERNNPSYVLIAAFIASLALIFSHIRRHHFQLNKYLTATLLGSFLFALELVASKSLLPYYSSLAFYFIRCSIIFLVSLIILRPSPKYIDKKSWLFIFLSSGLWIANRMLLYFGYMHQGVIFTTLLFIIAPVFIYILARIFLKEKLTWRNILATIIILACVSFVVFMNS